jgi:YCII-related domain
MTNYMLAYRGGGGMAATEEERERLMGAWGAWLGGLGDSVVDTGNPFGESRSVGSDGAVSGGGAAGLSGYTIVSASDIDGAAAFARNCPIFDAGGSVEVYEVVPVM